MLHWPPATRVLLEGRRSDHGLSTNDPTWIYCNAESCDGPGRGCESKKQGATRSRLMAQTKRAQRKPRRTFMEIVQDFEFSSGTHVKLLVSSILQMGRNRVISTGNFFLELHLQCPARPQAAVCPSSTKVEDTTFVAPNKSEPDDATTTDETLDNQSMTTPQACLYQSHNRILRHTRLKICHRLSLLHSCLVFEFMANVGPQ